MSLRTLIDSIKGGELLLPALRDFLSREDEAIRCGALEHKQVVIKDAEMSMACFKSRKEEYNHRQQLEGEMFHPSQLGRCLRDMVFDALHAPQDNGGKISGIELLKQSMIFEFGTYVHVLFQNLCDRAGLLVAREVAIIDRVNRHLGHGDGILLIKGEKYLLEIKTINARGFAALKEVKDAHRKQASAYMKSLGLKACIVVYICKDDSKMKEYVLYYSERYYSDQVAPRIDIYFKAIKRIRSPLFRQYRMKYLPAREGTNPSGMPCSYCSHRRLCYDSQASEQWIKNVKL